MYDIPNKMVTKPTPTQPVLVSSANRFWWSRAHYRNWTCLCWILIIIALIALIGLIVGLSVWAASREDEKEELPYPPPSPPPPSTPAPPEMDTVTISGKITILNWDIDSVSQKRDFYQGEFCEEMERATEPFEPSNCKVMEFGYGSVIVTYSIELNAMRAKYPSEVYSTINCDFGKMESDMQMSDYYPEIDVRSVQFLDHHNQYRVFEVCYNAMDMHSNCKNYINGYTPVYHCECPFDYKPSRDGYLCEPMYPNVPCPNGYQLDENSQCMDVNECDSMQMCPTGQMCVNTKGSYKCYSTPCDLMPCENLPYTSCEISSNTMGYDCQCIPGYYKNDDNICMMEDEE